MKKHFRKLAAYFVTVYANRIYKQAITAAENRWEEEKTMMYVITDPGNPKRLIVINTKEFLDLRHRFKILSKQLPLHAIRNRCWYHTGNVNHRDQLTPKDIEIRRLAFIRESLKRAKL